MSKTKRVYLITFLREMNFQGSLDQIYDHYETIMIEVKNNFHRLTFLPP